MAARDTGLPQTDAQFDFGRQRRRRALSRISARLRREPSDVNMILPFEEVVAALGRRGERRLGLETIALDSIVGTVDRGREFDRSFRPTSGRVRPRWERIATAQRRGQAMPPIDVYRIGELHFVRDGHHRVSVARALSYDVIEAWVTEVITELGADRAIRLADLPLKSHQRLFYERVPLPAEARAEIDLSDEWRYASLAEAVEAWGFRAIQDRREALSRAEVAEAWFLDEYRPVVEMLREAELIRRGTETEAYMRVSALRFLILRTHEWDDEVIERLRQELAQPTWEDDTVVRRLRKELR
ncbi:MAG: chromosome partitioning protein ParB [Thermoleophilaceae bacterium]